MKALGLVIMAALAGSAQTPGTPVASSATAAMPACSEHDLVALAVPYDEAQAHRPFPVPVLRYDKGTRPNTIYGQGITVRVETDGRISCASLTTRFHQAMRPEMTPERRSALDGLAAVRFEPFVRNASAVPAIVVLPLGEADRPTHRQMPNVALDRVHVRLEREGCFGTCPSYSIDVWGDGRVRYVGHGYVDVKGTHEFRIPREAVAGLVARARELDLWSMAPSYQGGITDHPTYRVRLDLGDASHQIEDYVGELAGMPPEVSEFEDEIDRVSNAAAFVELAPFAVDVLEAEGFAFASSAGAALLADATANPDVGDDAHLVRLLALGAPITGASPQIGFGDPQRAPLIEDALLFQRPALVDALIERGALETRGRVDPAKRDAALLAAIRGGNLALVQRIWNVDARRPSLTFVDTDQDSRKTVRAPLVLALERERWRDRPWEGLAIARWLGEQGVDLRGNLANGDTLLHIATEGEDIAFVRVLLDMGFDPNAKGDYGLPALGSTSDEDITLLLLQAGTDVSPLEDAPGGYLSQARADNMRRVVEWLENQSKAHAR